MIFINIFVVLLMYCKLKHHPLNSGVGYFCFYVAFGNWDPLFDHFITAVDIMDGFDKYQQ